MQVGDVQAKYERSGELAREVRRDAREALARDGLDPRSDPRMHRKAAIVVGWLAASWIAAVFVVDGVASGAIAVLSLALAAAAVPMAITHDACHGAFSRSRLANAIARHGANFVGICTPWWLYKHDALHHGWTGVDGVDDDLDQGTLLRLSEAQPHRWWHRWQHLYAFALYPFLHLSLFVTGLRFLATGRVGHRRAPGLRTRERVHSALALGLGAVTFLVVPCAIHPPWIVLVALAASSCVMGTVLALVFQVQHCVEGVRPPTVDPRTGRLPADWATCQIEATSGHSHGSRWITWYTGALNHHVEHHLFPGVAHVHLPRLAPIVEEACRRHGVRYRVEDGWLDALQSHARFLRALGRPARRRHAVVRRPLRAELRPIPVVAADAAAPRRRSPAGGHHADGLTRPRGA